MLLPNRLPVIGIMGSGSQGHDERARPLGSWLASRNVHLLTGGGGGVMAAASRAFYEVQPRPGLVLGIIPGQLGAEGYHTKAGYPNPWVEIPVYTHLPDSGSMGMEQSSRNHINILSSTAIIALPGGSGTASEAALALEYGRPIIAYLADRSEIPGLDSRVRVTDDLATVQEFILSHIA